LFHIKVYGEPSELVIVSDKVKLKQIFINLISNAFKFTEEGTIECGCKFDSNNNLVFYVSDTGKGIPVNKQEIVFERFAQLDPGENKMVTGTGLGLSIVKGLVHLLGGNIVLESEVGKGSTFLFTFPYKNAQIMTPKAPEIQTKNEQFNFPNKTVLIVEDDTYNAEYLKEILKRSGVIILHAVYGTDAIDLALSNPVDLVLMDIRLPDMDGYEAILQIKKHKPDLKIIAQTAYASLDENQNALDAGCVGYISKPTKREALLGMLQKTFND
jgi:CheY-like chemotaxis protein